jgi:hypothetical protein
MYKRGYQRHYPDLNTKPLAPERLERALHGEALRNPTAPLSAGAIEAKALMEKAKSLLKGETSMPDFNTALRTAIEKKDIAIKSEQLKATLDEWDKDDQQSTQPKANMTNNGKNFEVTNNVTRETFDFVKAHPGLTNGQITDALVRKGFKSTSVQSLVGQMVLAGLFVRDENRRITAVAPEFRKFNINAIRKAVREKSKAPQAKREAVYQARVKRDEAPAGLTALKVPAPVTAPQDKFDPDTILRSLNIVDARRLYDALKQIFGA